MPNWAQVAAEVSGTQESHYDWRQPASLPGVEPPKPEITQYVTVNCFTVTVPHPCRESGYVHYQRPDSYVCSIYTFTNSE